NIMELINDLQTNEKYPYIFISYSHRNSEKVVQILDRLCKERYNIWYDIGIVPGTDWDTNIAEHISDCTYFIAFISEEYLESSNCRDEINYARDIEKKMVLVYLSEVSLPSGMSMRLNRLQAIHRISYPDDEAFYQKLFSSEGLDECRLTEEQMREPPEKKRVLPRSSRKNNNMILWISCTAAALVLMITAAVIIVFSSANSTDIPIGTSSSSATEPPSSTIGTAAFPETNAVPSTTTAKTADSISGTPASDRDVILPKVSEPAFISDTVKYKFGWTIDKILEEKPSAELLEEEGTQGYAENDYYFSYSDTCFGNDAGITLFFNKDKLLFRYSVIIEGNVWDDLNSKFTDLFGYAEISSYRSVWNNQETGSFLSLYIKSYGDDEIYTVVEEKDTLYLPESTPM
ncbi:MAG: toll/interleukin-1 receptor domain-containing protein, partial [Ruminiclostridium sp.]|nr:toll/interleukin-1 receptor domain-containing protein [Ruminiclostridium sp.]